MMRTRFASFVASALMVAVIAPVAFTAAAPRAYAIDDVIAHVVSDTSATNIGTLIKSTLTSVATFTSSVANVALQIDKYVLEPIAYVVSGAMLRSLVSGIIAFVAGTANGTGVPQFVTNVAGNLQKVGDVQTVAFLNNYAQSSKSPFSASIVSSLRTNYLQQATLAGFFAANQSTLSAASPNPTAFISGNVGSWAQGGIPAWFALTTQSQNNPYAQYNNAQLELSKVVTGAQQVRLQELNWGNGFLSWCGATPKGVTAPAGFLPGDACTKADGTTGAILTPGAVIKASLDKAIGTPIDRLINVGNVAPEVNTIFSNLATVMKTVSLGQQILGQLGSCGLSGVVGACSSSGLASGSSASPLSQYQNSSELGVSLASVYANPTTQAAAGGGMPDRIQQYQSDWNTIGQAADAATASLQALISYCQSQPGATAQQQAALAQQALDTQVAPVTQQFAQANSIILAAEALVQRLASETPTDSSATAAAATASSFASDTLQLSTMSPTPSDVANADQQATTFGDAQANPTGSLNVTATSLVDKMNLLNANAQASFGTCVPQSAGLFGGQN
jgi:hypothetical protein